MRRPGTSISESYTRLRPVDITGDHRDLLAELRCLGPSEAGSPKTERPRYGGSFAI
jgi:hypothetical protein